MMTPSEEGRAERREHELNLLPPLLRWIAVMAFIVLEVSTILIIRRLEPLQTLPPEAHPYLFQVEINELPVRTLIDRVRFTDRQQANLILVKSDYPLLDISELDTLLQPRHYMHSLGRQMSITKRAKVDADGDGLDELLYNRWWGQEDETLAYPPMDSLEFGYVDSLRRRVPLAVIHPDTSREYRAWASKMNVLWDKFRHETVALDSIFPLVHVGYNDAFDLRTLYLYRKGVVPQQVKRIDLAHPVFTGAAYRDQGGREHLLFTGGMPCNGLREQVETVDSLVVWDDCSAQVTQMDAEGNIQWVQTIGEGGGNCWALAPQKPGQPILAIHTRASFIREGSFRTTFHELSPSNGEVLNSWAVDARFWPLQGGAALEQGFLGILQSSLEGVQLVTTDGEVESLTEIEISRRPALFAMVEAADGTPLVVLPSGKRDLLLFSLAGKILGRIQNVTKGVQPLRIQHGSLIRDYLAVEGADQLLLGRIVKNPSPFWFLKRYSRYVFFMLLIPVPFVIAFVYLRHQRKDKLLIGNLERERMLNIKRIEQMEDSLRDCNEGKAAAREEIQQLLGKTALDQQNLRAMLGAIEEPLVLLDGELRIQFCNDAFKRRLNVETPEGSELSDVYQGVLGPLVSPAKSCLEQRQNLQSQVILGAEKPREYRVHAIFQSAGGDGDQVMLLLLEAAGEVPEVRREAGFSFQGMIGASREMQGVFETIKRISDTLVTVLITGESGVGKERVAQAIHETSKRAEGPFYAINVAALSESLLGSELFGHKRGAFTGALTDRVGKFEAADKGTLFLDEIGEVSGTVQVKLLRVLQQQSFERVGENTTRHTNARIIAATNKDLQRAMREGGFREDLFYRLNVINIHIPPLRTRREDIPYLAQAFLEQHSHELGKPVRRIDSSAISRLMVRSWPGNVRELGNAILVAVTNCEGEVVQVEDLPPEENYGGNETPGISDESASPPGGRRGGKLNREAVIHALEQERGVVSRAADVLGVTRQHLHRKMKEYDLRREDFAK